MTTPEALRAQNLFPEFDVTENEKFMFEAFEGRLDELGSVCTPEKAQKELERCGYDASLWERVVREKIGSHDIRSLAIIALGNQARLQYVIYANLRVIDHFEGWPYMRNDMGIQPTINDPDRHTTALRQAMAKAQEASDSPS